MKKKRIAFVCNSLYGGGAERILQVILNHFDQSTYDITLISHLEDKPDPALYPSDIRYKGILKNINLRKSVVSRILTKLYNKINLIIYENFSPRVFRLLYQRETFDIEIAFIEGYATRIVSGGRSLKKIAWVHCDLKASGWTEIAFRSKSEEIACYKTFNDIISVSEGVKKSVEELLNQASKVIYNPINKELIHQKASEVFSSQRKKGVRFVTLGRLVEVKGYRRLIKIIHQLAVEGFRLELWILGDGEDRERLTEYIDINQLTDYIKFWGFVENPYPYMVHCDVFVCSSYSEGYSTVATEAIILGLPVITTLCAGMEELLGNNQYGMIVENNETALLNGMRNILNDQTWIPRYAHLAKERGKDFSLEKQMNEIYCIIEKHL